MSRVNYASNSNPNAPFNEHFVFSSDYGRPKHLIREENLRRYKEATAARLNDNQPSDRDPDIFLSNNEFQRIYQDLNDEDDFEPFDETLPEYIPLLDGKLIEQPVINTLRDKIVKGRPLSIGRKLTPSSLEKLVKKIVYAEGTNYLKTRESKNFDETDLKMKGFLGEIIHYFSFLVLYNTLMLYSNELDLHKNDLIRLFFGEFNLIEYEKHKDRNGNYDLSYLLKNSAKSKHEFNESNPEILSETSLFLDFSSIDSIEISNSDLKLIIERSLKEIDLYVQQINISESKLREKVLKMINENLPNMISHAQSIYQILMNHDLKRATYKLQKRENELDSGQNRIRIISEQPIIINTAPQESTFFPESFSHKIAITNKRTRMKKLIKLLEQCKLDYPYEFRFGEDQTLHLDLPIQSFNIQFQCKSDLMIFEEDEQGKLHATIYDYKLSNKDINDAGIKLNVFIYKIAAAAAIYTRTLYFTGEPIMISHIDLDDPEFERILVEQTRFYFSVFNSGDLTEALCELSPFELSELKLQVRYLTEASIVYSNAIKSELESF